MQSDTNLEIKPAPRIRDRIGIRAARAADRSVMPVNRDVRRVLVINDSKAASRLLGEAIQSRCERQVDTALTLAQAVALLADKRREYYAAVVGLELQDAKGTSIVEFALAHGLSTIILTGSWREETRKSIFRYPIFDYFVKGRLGIEDVCRALNRIPRNNSTKVLVVDDSEVARDIQAAYLNAHRFHVLFAVNGADALQALSKHPDTTLVITDNEMPIMDGITLTTRIREFRGRDELAIIGVAAQGSPATAVRFLKHGASDFLAKPFEKEEFYCRVYNCIGIIEHARAITKAAFTDSLTGLSNRLAFFTQAPAIFSEIKKCGDPLAVAMLDIDFFKKVNDTHGHGAGDEVLRHVAAITRECLGETGVVARFGGEEFCALCRGMDRAAAWAAFDKLRAVVAASSVDHEGQTIRVTLSIGVALNTLDSLDETINHADQLLYEAKNGGRNRVVMTPSLHESGYGGEGEFQEPDQPAPPLKFIQGNPA